MLQRLSYGESKPVLWIEEKLQDLVIRVCSTIPGISFQVIFFLTSRL
jgi:hypothetical protein